MLHYSTSIIQSLTHCTHGAPSGRCAIFQQLPPLNVELSKVDLELQESAPGQLTLTTVVKNGHPVLHCDDVTPSLGRLLEIVLWHHRCIVSVDVDIDDLRAGRTILLVNIIVDKVKSLVSLRLRDMFETEAQQQSLGLVLFNAADNLQELHLQNRVTLTPLCTFIFRDLVRRTHRLTTLSITNVHIHSFYAAQLFQGLSQNSSIHTLTASMCMCFHGAEHGAEMIAAIARRQALKSLNLERCCFECAAGVKSIMKALAENRSLSALSLRGFGFAIAFQELMPTLLTGNDALKSLRIECHNYYYNDVCSCNSGPPGCTECPLGCLTEEYINLDLLTAGISKNKRLEELTIDLSTSELSMCQRFFEALRMSKTLRRVIIMGVIHSDAEQICRAIRQNGLQNRVNITCQLAVDEPLEVVAVCTDISTVAIDYAEPLSRELLHRTLTLLPDWQHIRDLFLRLPSEQLVSGFEHFQCYLQRTTKLRNLNLVIVRRFVDQDVRRNLVKTLFLNRSMRKLSVVGQVVVHPDEAEDLAHMLCANDTLCEFSLIEDYSRDDYDLVPMETILQHMSSHMARNRTLCSLQHGKVSYSGNFHTVHNVVRRNRALAMCAAHFVVGTDRSGYCAEAFSLLAHSPQLLLNVMEMAAVEEAEATTRIQLTLTEQELRRGLLH
ncbi:hypothetical protein HPB49_014508 [Dermacentor silvarum]|uniref:Uncharacterized protein n=1 Tax=Dermacentor silvarum TaxID=543639 RepID=A0ACB8C461_DERSI|nr:hypothetical protein HPB49_014508 [Dermacentor silvarum]